MSTLVAGDVRAIQELIFGSPRLSEMRGASALISLFDRRVVRHLARQHRGKVVFSGGGNFLVLFDDLPERPENSLEPLADLEKDREPETPGGEAVARPAEERARLFATTAANTFLDLTGGHEITIETLSTSLPFAQAQAELHRRLRRRKNRPSEVMALASMPYLKRCESCGREAADVPLRPVGEPNDSPRREWLGPACESKRRMSQALGRAQELKTAPRRDVFGIARSLRVSPLHPRLAGAELPADFQELAGDDDLAVLAADGNGLGSWFEGLDQNDTRSLSLEVDRSLRAAFVAGLDAAFPGQRDPRVQLLICGGDDLLVALPARSALKFAEALLDRFRVPHPRDPARVAGLSVGLLLSRPSFPIRQAHALAEELLARAKKRCRRDGLLAAFDFLRVTATHVQALAAELAARESRRDPETWRYGAAGPYSAEQLGDLRKLAAELRLKVSASQRGRLREILAPRGEGSETPMDLGLPLPARVAAEYEAWRLRQDEAPFDEELARHWHRFVREERPNQPLAETTYGWVLCDALILAELGED